MKSALVSQIHDSNMLKKGGAEFSFSKDLICKVVGMSSFLLRQASIMFIHERHYGGLYEEYFREILPGIPGYTTGRGRQHISGLSTTKVSCLPCSCRKTSRTARA